MAKRKHGVKSGPILFDLLRKDTARVMSVLHKHGVYFDAGTYITMTATPEKAAAYHAVPDKKKFLKELFGK